MELNAERVGWGFPWKIRCLDDLENLDFYPKMENPILEMFGKSTKNPILDNPMFLVGLEGKISIFGWMIILILAGNLQRLVCLKMG